MVVKAKPEEKLTMNASVTGVKTITVEFNKAIADASKVKATVKKGTADRACTATVDGSKITLAMDAKLTKGDYTVSVEGVADAAMTANVTVEKNETLTSFWIGDYIVAESLTSTTTGTIKYAGLNQYGEKMPSNDVTVTCSFGKVPNQKPDKASTATAEGSIKVTDIPEILTIVGTKGTVVIVGDMGVTTTKEISYNTFSKAVSAEVLGTYHVNSATLKNISEGDKPSDYELLFSLKDQYGYSVSADDANKSDKINITLVGGLTNVTVAVTDNQSYKTRTVNGVDYIAVTLKAASDSSSKAYAGDATLTIVNQLHGLLVSQPLTVGKSVVISSINITADNGVYEDQENEMAYEIVDTEGKAITSYAVLSNPELLSITGMRFEKKADGTAKLIYEVGDLKLATQNTSTDKNYTTRVVNAYANNPTGGNYIVKTFSFTVNQKRVAKSVSGIAADTTTSIAKNANAPLTIESKKFVLADQYSNKVVDGDGAFVKTIYDAEVSASTGVGTSVYLVNDGSLADYNIDVANNKIIVTPGAKAGTSAVYLKYATKAGVKASASDYDAKFYISVYDTTGVDVSTLAIKSIHDGFALSADNENHKATVDKSKVTVVAKVGGVETVIPQDQFVIVKEENNSFSQEEINKGVWDKTAKLTVQVTTWDSANTPIDTQITKEYTVSRSGAKLYKVTGTDATAATHGAIKTYDKEDFVKMFTYKNQYGADVNLTSDTVDKNSISYEIKFVKRDGGEISDYTISNNKLNSAKLTIKNGATGKYTFKITATSPDGSSKDFTFTVGAGL